MKKFILFTLVTACFPFICAGGDLEEAAALYFSFKPEESLEKYIDISKKSGEKEAFLNAAFIAIELGKTKNSVDIMTAAYKNFPEDRLVLEFLGEAYLSDGQFLNAEKIFSTLTQSEEKKGFYYNNLARAQLGLGENKMAEHNFKMALENKAQTSFANFMLGLIYEKQKNWEDAKTYFKKAMEYDHQFFEARRKYADMLYKTGDKDEAWKQYRSIYSVEKTDEIKKLIAELEPKLTKTQDEILKPKKLSVHSDLAEITALAPGLPVIRVGLGAEVNGKPAAREALVFSPSYDFTVTEVSTKKILSTGPAKKEWTAVIEKNSAFLKTHEDKKIPFTAGVMITQAPPEGKDATVIIKELSSGSGMTWASIDDKEYRGDLEIIHNAKLKTLVPVNHINLDKYLLGVLSSEMPPNFPPEALKAQAILARTYALKHMGKHKAHSYDVCDTQHCQVYGGVQRENMLTNASVGITSGLIVTYKNKPIEAVFSSNSGGITQSSKNAGWFDHEYLTSRSDYKDIDLANLQPYRFKELLQQRPEAYCDYTNRIISSAAYRWTRVVDIETINRLANNRKKIGRVLSVTVEGRAKSGYINKIKVTGEKGYFILNTENSIKKNLSTGLLRSSFFMIQPVYEKRKLKEFVFFGGGWGHGVGFCQTGAAGRAKEGQDFKTILMHYLPHTEITDISKQ